METDGRGHAYFDSEGHLTEAGILLYVQAMKQETLEELPVMVYNHVYTCTDCSIQVLERYYELMVTPTLTVAHKSTTPLDNFIYEELFSTIRKGEVEVELI